MSENNRQDSSRHLLDEIEEMEQQELENQRKQKPKFNLFDKYRKESEGVSKDEIAIADDPSFKNFFKLIGRKINQLLSVNLLLLAGNFPVIFLLLGRSGYLSVHTTQPAYAAFPPLRGALMFHNSAALSALWSIFSRQAEVRVYTTWDYVMFGLGALVLFTFGPVRVGVTYILRNMFRGEGVFFTHDFFYAIKRNLRQSVIMGLFDIAIVALLIKAVSFYNAYYSENMMMSIGFFTSLALAVIYFLMRPYIYLMLVTFDIGIFKMIKNSFLFTILGIKRNIVVLLGTVAVAALEYCLLLIYVPLGVIVPFVILPSLLIMMGVYGAYPKIKEIMIDPYYKKSSDDPSSTEEA